MMTRPAAVALAAAAGAAALAAAVAVAGLGSRARTPASSARPADLITQTAGREAAARQLSLARQLLDQGEHSGAAAALDRALEADPGNVEALGLQVRTLRMMRQYSAARAVAHRLREILPNSALPHVLLASTSLQEGDANSARQELERAVQLDPGSPLALGQLAALDQMEGRTDSARQLAQRALSLDPGNGAALRVLGAQTRDVGELVGIQERLVEDNPGDLFARGWMEALRACGCEEVNRISAPQSEIIIPLVAEADGRLTAGARLKAGGRSQAVRLLVDTGASGLVISESFARRIGLALDEFIESAGLGGATRHSHPILVDEISFPGVPALRARTVMATASDFGRGHDGILNPLLLVPPGSGRILELRPARREMAILPARRSGQPAGRAWVTVPFLSDGLHAIYGLMVADRPTRALLDTGAGADLIDRSLLRWLPRPEPAAEAPGAPAGGTTEAGMTLMGFAGQVAGARRAESVPIRMAGHTVTPAAAWVLDLNADSFRLRVDLGAVVGIGTLRNFDIRIDRAAGRLSFRSVQ